MRNPRPESFSARPPQPRTLNTGLPPLRTVLFWLHLACGVTAGAVILIMCVTGVALTYQKEMQWWADTRHYHAPPAADARRATVGALLNAVRAFEPEATPSILTWRADPSAPVAAPLGARTVYLNPYTAAVYGEGTGRTLREIFATMTTWHRYLALAGEQRARGKAITGAANLVFLFIVVSGLYLWLPRTVTWATVRNLVWFRRGLRPKARDFNWHHAIGFWSALPLAVIVYSATVISYPWSSDLVYRAVGEDPPAPAGGRGAAPAGRGDGAAVGAEVEWAVERARQFRLDWAAITLRVPESAALPLVFTIDEGDAGQPNRRGTLTIDPVAHTERWEGFSAQSRGRRLRTWLRFAHTGEIYGLAGQTIAGGVSAGGAVLVYTGLALTWRRFRAWQVAGRRVRRQDAA